jgi:hypothetical protein
MRSLENSTEDYEEIFEWIYEYLPKAMKKNEDLVSALEYLGKADVILQRIKRTNDWSQLPYFLKLFAAGVALSNSSAEVSEIYYGERPDRLKNKWKYYNAWKRLESSSLVLSQTLHCGSQRVKSDILPLYKLAANSKGGKIFIKTLQEIGVEL